jgi:acetylxylan esterase
MSMSMHATSSRIAKKTGSINMMFLTGMTSLLAAMTSLAVVQAASLTRVNNFGSNPANVKMYIYVPENVRSNPDVVVAIHHCQGTAQSYFGSTPYANLANQHGYIVIYPESPYSGTCWDVSSPATLKYEGGGDSNSIANMVKYTLQQYKANPARVFVVGGSSGAMMTVSPFFPMSKGLRKY